MREMTNDQLFGLYDQELVLRLHNAKNLADTRTLLARFGGFLGAYPPSPELAKGFLAQYVDRKPRTLYRYAQMVKAFMKWYGQPVEDLKVKIPRTLPPYTEDSDVEKLFRTIESKQTHKGCIVRDGLLVALALKTGMRRSELADLEAQDVHPDFLIVRSGKGGKDRMIPLAPSVAGRLSHFIVGKGPSEKVFGLKAVSISEKIRRLARKAGLDGFHAHTMRHKFATDLVEKGAPVTAVQELLGHENLATTQVYLSMTKQGLRDAVNLLDGDKERGGQRKATTVQDEGDWICESLETTDSGIQIGWYKRA